MGTENDKKWCPICELEDECPYYKNGCCTLDNPLEDCDDYATLMDYSEPLTDCDEDE